MGELGIKALRARFAAWRDEAREANIPGLLHAIPTLLDAAEERDALRGRVEWWPMWEALRDVAAERAALRAAARTLLVVLGDDRVSRSEAARNLDALLPSETTMDFDFPYQGPTTE